MQKANVIRTAGLVVIASLAIAVGPAAKPAFAATSDTYESQTITATNTQRVKGHDAKVKASTCVDTYAEAQAKAMAKAHKMYHQNMQTILSKCKLHAVGENVAYGFPNASAVVTAWMHSPGHKANLMNSRYRLIGVGAVQDSRGVWYVSQVFGEAR